MAARKRSAATKAPKDRATAYARDVVEGRVLAGRPVRLACERHLRDMKDGKKRGLVWRPEMSERVIDFFSDMLVLEDVDADGAHVPFKMQPFQCFIYGSICGWYGADGFRRFRTAYVETGKGSGKTPGAAGLGLYGMIADGEPAPEVYSAATTADQASIAWKDAKRMVEDSPELRELVDVQVGALSIPTQHAVFRAVSAEHRGLDGKRPHIGIIDEFHEHPSNIVIEKIRAGVKRRRNAIIFVITNSGYDKTSPCWKYHQYALEVLEGLKENDALFAYVCALDLCDKCRPTGNKGKDCKACDDWADPKVWIKANPGLGSILPESYLREQVEEAKGMPSKENIVLRLNFCVWTEQFTRWIDMAAWDACGAPFDLAVVRELPCVAGLDMATRSDFAAFVMLFGPDDEGRYYVLPRFWLPSASVEAGPSKRTEADREMLKGWADAGLITLTPGDTTDYDLIEEAIKQDVADYGVRMIGFDRWNVTQMITHLQDALGKERLIDVPQTLAALTAPCRELEDLLREGALRHGGNPVLRWMASNTTVRFGPDKTMKPDKEASAEKIDGITGTVNALKLAAIAPPEAQKWDGEVLALS